MDFVFSKGKITRQAHVGIPEGTYEEEHGRETFFGRASHLYRMHPPTAWTRIDGTLRPRALDLNEMKPEDQVEANASWALVAGNEDVRLYVSRRAEPMEYFLRDADGDVCYFVHRGNGTIETDYGPLTFDVGDYIIIPKGTTHRIVPEGDDNFFFVIEGTGEFGIPDRGLMGRHAMFDPGVLEVPEPDPHDESGEFEVRVKRDGEFTSLFFAWHPLDVVGWQGDLCPVKLNILNHRPVYSPSYHMPPSAHATFKNEGFVICSFVPRPLEEDPAVLKVPFYHANIDADEVLFYHSGNYFSRAGIDVGYMTLHPQGVHHGPQPAAIEKSKSLQRTEEVAVMVETEKPLELSDEAKAVVITEYETSWAQGMGLLDT
ncbi:MAG TPA: homogentisate 1,2-dioxygenase [Actinomycetota bacterium]|jgi:homogentisate 1,2-dioxygenase|nr:homogentisate 1,2-dioxygenase [Actinomycetota bacterium]